MPSTCTMGWWEISRSNFEKFFKTFANVEHSTSGTSVEQSKSESSWLSLTEPEFGATWVVECFVLLKVFQWKNPLQLSEESSKQWTRPLRPPVCKQHAPPLIREVSFAETVRKKVEKANKEIADGRGCHSQKFNEWAGEKSGRNDII